MPRAIIIGDIHGCYGELLDLCAAVGLNDGDTLVSVGDLVDRGPGSVEVVDFFRNRANSLVLCGNHERKHVGGSLTYAQEIVRLRFAGRYADAVGWMGTLPYFYEDANIRIVHAGLIPGVPLAETPTEILSGTISGEERLKARLGGRLWHELYEDEVPVAFGHHVVGPQPLVVKDRVFGLDTGACFGMALSALVLPEGRLVSVPARANHWKTEQKRWQVPVLASRPWATMSFEQLVKKTDELAARHPDADTIAWLDGTRAWAAAVLASVPVIRDKVESEIARIRAESGDHFTKAAATHPVGTVLIRYALGRLSSDHLGCATPEAVFALADKLGITLTLPRVPPGA